MFGNPLPRTPVAQPWDMFCIMFAELLFGITVLLNWGNTFSLFHFAPRKNNDVNISCCYSYLTQILGVYTLEGFCCFGFALMIGYQIL